MIVAIAYVLGAFAVLTWMKTRPTQPTAMQRRNRRHPN